MSVYTTFQSIEASGMGDSIRSSLWLFPVIESFHLLALALIGGAVLVLDLRLFGYGTQRQPPAQLWHDTHPYMLTSLIVMIISGLMLFTSEATKLYYHDAFWFKMACLLLSIIFTYAVIRPVSLHSERIGSATKKLVAVVSVLLWLGVGIGGRWIGFS